MYLIQPRVFEDPRGFFMETYHQAKFAAAGISAVFVQDNHSRSARGTLRGLHYQIQHAQGKLVRAVSGRDLRRGGRSSPGFADVRPVGGGNPQRRQQAATLRAAGIRPWILCDSAKSPKSFTNAPICITPNTNAACCGTTRNLASTGRSTTRSSPPKTKPVRRWPMRIVMSQATGF